METARATRTEDKGVQIAEAAREALDERHGEDIVLIDNGLRRYCFRIQSSSPESTI